jgi:predicted nucleic acid-binding protein
MIVLDTNVVSEMVRATPDLRVLHWLQQLDDDVAITAVTWGELFAGLRRLPDGRRRHDLEDAVSQVVRKYRTTGAVLAFDWQAADAYADVLVERQRAGLPISTADAQIAAICRTNGALCATRNIKDFAQTGVEVVNPWSH